MANRKTFYFSAAGLILLSTGVFTASKMRPNAHYEGGLKNLRAGNFSSATSELRLCLQEEPDNKTTHYVKIGEYVVKYFKDKYSKKI
ncbi:MAG: hypothetical protein EOP84_06260, partial [Verrucomicrobiaceae bacterium]